jgi:hypothetical protein
MGTTGSVRLGQIMAVVLKFRQFVPPWFPFVAVLPQEPGEFLSLLRLFSFISTANDKNLTSQSLQGSKVLVHRIYP